MMPMQMRRKALRIEKVENLSRTATAQKILPTRRNKSDRACAIPWTNFLPAVPPCLLVTFCVNLMESAERGPDAAAERCPFAPVPPAASLVRSACLTLRYQCRSALPLRTAWTPEIAIRPADAALAGYESFRHRIL
jgi:hypothetical protein